MRFRELSAPDAHIEKEIALAHSFWRALRVQGWVDFPEDVRASAAELGFLDPEVDAEYRRGIATARESYALARDLGTRLEAANLPNITVAVSERSILLAGTVLDESARVRGRAIAAAYLQDAGVDLVLDDRIVVSPRT